jgi:hypothetical protein
MSWPFERPAVRTCVGWLCEVRQEGLCAGETRPCPRLGGNSHCPSLVGFGRFSASAASILNGSDPGANKGGTGSIPAGRGGRW